MSETLRQGLGFAVGAIAGCLAGIIVSLMILIVSMYFGREITGEWVPFAVLVGGVVGGFAGLRYVSKDVPDQ